MKTILPKAKWHWRLLVAFFVTHVLLLMVWMFSMFREPPGLSFLFNFLLFVIGYICLEIVILSQTKLSEWLNLENVAFKNGVSILGSIILGTTTYCILFYFFKWLDYFVNHSEPPMIQHMVSALLVGFVMTTIFALMQLVIVWKNQHYDLYVKTQAYKKEIVDANLSILKHQLDPHFMFNNFNTLYYLIEEDSLLAQKFLKNVSDIYRYILQNNDRNLVPVLEEYTIVKQYLEILQERYLDAIEINDMIDIKCLEHKKIPPLALQQLVENTIKHNSIDIHKPLKITLRADEESFTLINNMNPKHHINTGKTGIKNIEKRYQYLTQEKVIVEKTSTIFKISIPLLSYLTHAN